MSEPTPSPRPLPPPIPPPGDSSQAVNMKKIALDNVLHSIAEARRDLGADSAEIGTTSPSESLVNGLGGDGSVWKSSMADKIHADLSGIIKRITSCFSSQHEKVCTERDNEPQYVDQNDPRAHWRAQ